MSDSKKNVCYHCQPRQMIQIGDVAFDKNSVYALDIEKDLYNSRFFVRVKTIHGIIYPWVAFTTKEAALAQIKKYLQEHET